jgi:hypothetical protein
MTPPALPTAEASLLTQRAIAFYIWERCLLQPYRWGGDDPIWGFDCSGLVIEGLKGANKFHRDKDATAAGLATMYLPAPVLRPGCLLFWGNPIIHVEVVWQIVGGQPYTIGASGGGSSTRTQEDAARFNAYVKIRPARPGWVRAVDPFLES